MLRFRLAGLAALCDPRQRSPRGFLIRCPGSTGTGAADRLHGCRAPDRWRRAPRTPGRREDGRRRPPGSWSPLRLRAVPRSALAVVPPAPRLVPIRDDGAGGGPRCLAACRAWRRSSWLASARRPLPLLIRGGKVRGGEGAASLPGSRRPGVLPRLQRSGAARYLNCAAWRRRGLRPPRAGARAPPGRRKEARRWKISLPRWRTYNWRSLPKL